MIGVGRPVDGTCVPRPFRFKSILWGALVVAYPDDFSFRPALRFFSRLIIYSMAVAAVYVAARQASLVSLERDRAQLYMMMEEVRELRNELKQVGRESL